MSKKITTIGGQALMEGIMMVGPKRTVAAFCDEEGNISTETIVSDRLTKKYPILGKPFIRGIFSLIDSFRMDRLYGSVLHNCFPIHLGCSAIGY